METTEYLLQANNCVNISVGERQGILQALLVGSSADFTPELNVSFVFDGFLHKQSHTLYTFSFFYNICTNFLLIQTGNIIKINYISWENIKSDRKEMVIL